MRVVRALPIPNFDSSINEIKLKRAERSVAEVTRGMKEKENFVLYPSGRLKVSGKESLGGASGTQMKTAGVRGWVNAH